MGIHSKPDAVQCPKTWRLRHAAAAALVVVGNVAMGADALVNSVDAPTIWQEDDGASTMHQVGDLTHVYHADGSSAVHQRIGDISLITDSRPRMSGVAYHVGDAVYVQRPDSISYCHKVGDLMVCTRQPLVAVPTMLAGGLDAFAGVAATTSPHWQQGAEAGLAANPD